MNLGTLAASLPTKKASVYCLERGKESRHSFGDLAGEVTKAVENLKHWGVTPGARVGIYAPNSVSWLVYDLGLIQIGAVSVPFTDDFAGRIDRELLDKYQISLLLIARNSMSAPAKAPYIATMDGENDEVAAIPRPVQDGDAGLLTLAFSSGSAGGLKGLEISREGVEATLPPIVEVIGLNHDDRLLLFLPMSNFQQRTMCYAALWHDFDIIITDYIQLMAGIKLLSPTMLIAPPMFFQMTHARFATRAFAQKVLWKILGTLISLVPGEAARRSLAQSLFKEFHQQFGGRMRVLITGMAPIKRNVAEFFDLMQLPLCESYGMVESGSITYRPAGCKKYGSVGQPLKGVRLEFTEDGEIIVCREKTLTRRYFQSADGENERTFIGPDRIATGDMGRLDGDGYLYLLGRKKELIITPGGYKIHPEAVEKELYACPDIAQAAVFLKPGTTSLAGVVSLNPPGDEAMRARVRDFVKGIKFPKASQVTEVIFAEAPFSTENGMLRPNLKLDRRAIAAKYNN